ncbi:MAG: AraC family transcriptional regulator [Goleter apudmare HA4340-LM2]|jgi:AraC-like DNA-binding protein|nr:AraC family transcriptional regulator [Goleter apudmare HA4340-LM2]
MVSVSPPVWQRFPKPDLEEWIYTDPLDPLDATEITSTKMEQSAVRTILLRQGLELQVVEMPFSQESSRGIAEDVDDGVEFHFHIQGQHDDELTEVGDREFCIWGSGLFPKRRKYAPEQQALEVSLWVEGEVLRSMLLNESGELPREVAHWLRSEDELCYARVGKVTPALERVLWEIVRCPWQGMQKRLFLESRALELLSLMMGWEQAIQGHKAIQKLPAGTRERLHYARELLLQNLHEPLTLEQLAQRSQISECTLKQGFKQEFGRTVFDYLLDYRLEQAREMLERGTMQVAEVMASVGLKNRSYFAAAFRQKFGQNPKQYQQQFWHFQKKD